MVTCDGRSARDAKVTDGDEEKENRSDDDEAREGNEVE